ncbi:hypothetical protein ACE3MQ_05185 [Paenibacillus lentus]|uniref:hypothetical protein n=1 Tax=Paenibacillus lentus TaxID=1338368 RepID=UPI0036627B68
MDGMGDVMFTVYTVFYAVIAFIVMLVWLKLKGRRKQKLQNEEIKQVAKPMETTKPQETGETVVTGKADET